MGNALISRRGFSYVKINYNNYYKISKIYHHKPETTGVASVEGAGTTAGNGTYAIFGGGRDGGGVMSNCTGVNDNLVRVYPSSLSSARSYFCGVDIGNYGLFCGGSTNGLPSGAVNTVDTYSSYLTKGTTTLNTSTHGPMGAKAGNSYAVIAGGINNSNYVSTVTAFNSSLTKTSGTTLSQARYNKNGGASAGEYAIFAGGISASGYSNKIDVYNSSLTKISTTITLNTARYNAGSAGVGNYAIFAGGETQGGKTNTVECISTSLVRTSLSTLTYTTVQMSAGKLGNYALFAGGYVEMSSGSGGYSATTYAYTSNLVRSIIDNLSQAREDTKVGRVGDYLVFEGGNTSTSGSFVGTIDAYNSDPTFCLPITAGSKYKFNDSTTETKVTSSTTLTFTEPITGYVKMKSGTI